MEIKWSSFHGSYAEEEVKKYVPKDAGVYMLWVQLKSGKWRCFYVGKGNLEERLLHHLSSYEENKCLSEKASKYICGFEYAAVSDENSRDGIEKYLYDYYSPGCNEVDPGGSPIRVNLP